MFARRFFSNSLLANSKVYVGNLAWGAQEEMIRETFAKYGAINDCFIVKDKVSGRSKGFGFVDFVEKESADNAIQGLNDSILEGRTIKVNHAIEKPKPSY